MPTATEKKTETVTFNSKSPNQVLVRRPERVVPDGFGGRVYMTEAEWFAQQEEKGEPFDETPWKVEFHDHIFKTDNPALIEWLRKRPTFGADVPSGFYEVQPAAEDLKPSQPERFDELSLAQAMNPDKIVPELKRIRKDEVNTHNRPAVLQAADAAISLYSEEPSESEADAGTGDGAPKSTSKD